MMYLPDHPLEIARLERDMTQRQLCRASGVSAGTIQGLKLEVEMRFVTLIYYFRLTLSRRSNTVIKELLGKFGEVPKEGYLFI